MNNQTAEKLLDLLRELVDKVNTNAKTSTSLQKKLQN